VSFVNWIAGRLLDFCGGLITMKIKLTSVPILDYDKALKFYTEELGLVKKHDIPLGEGARWLTVVSPQAPDGAEIVLGPNAEYPAMKALKESLMKDGIPYTAYQVDDIQQEYETMKKLGVEFTLEPTDVVTSMVAKMRQRTVPTSFHKKLGEKEIKIKLIY
jgi:catechol 2,3-dioxygenase-like lactoylglutathione lyase family enzyme